MTIKSKLALLIATIAFLCLAGWNSKAQVSSNTDWEYKIVTFRGHPDTPTANLTQINDLGEEGWEMVTVESEDVMHSNVRQVKRTYYFKRPA